MVFLNGIVQLGRGVGSNPTEAVEFPLAVLRSVGSSTLLGGAPRVASFTDNGWRGAMLPKLCVTSNPN